MVDNRSIITTPSFVVKRAPLPLKFELLHAFWKTKENLENITSIKQVNACPIPNQLLLHENVTKTFPDNNELYFVLFVAFQSLIEAINMIFQ